ncbi:MAG: tRNA (guanine-N7)-methyltransferase [Leptospirales bacterium]|jgi:tRNA (guanine-N7-)-methyltransferase
MTEAPVARLFQIATRPRPIHSQPEVVLPVHRDRPIPEEVLFRSVSNGANDTETPADGRRRILELGSGWGEFLAAWLAEHPDDDYTAFEIKSDRIRRTLKYLHKLPAPHPHLRVVPVNFTWFLEGILPPRSFDWIIINFPDPWPKRRHWKHRLVRPGFPERMAPLLRPGGQIHLATDYGPYARKMIQLFRRSAHFEAVFPAPEYLRRRPADVPLTRFEQITGAGEGRVPYFSRWRLRA